MINNLQSILTQDHLATEAPIFVVYSKQPVMVDGDFDYDKIIYVRGEDGLSYDEFDKLDSLYFSANDYRAIQYLGNDEVLEPSPKDPFNEEDDFDPHEWEQRFIKYVDKFEQAFFIRKNAEEFIENQSHRLGDGAYIYVESAYHNPEWQQIRELLIDKAKTQS